MKCNTGEEQFFDVGSLYARFKELKDLRKPKGLRYRSGTILVVMVLAKLYGEDNPSGGLRMACIIAKMSPCMKTVLA